MAKHDHDDAALHSRVRLAGVARAYYLDNRSKIEIGQQFGMSRFQVARLLDEARSSGVVSIEVHDPRLPRSTRELEVAALLGLDSIRIVEEAGDAAATPVERVGSAVLQQLAETVRPGMTVGISWSRTLDMAARFLTEMPPCTLVQLTGAFELPDGGTFTRLLMQLDRRGGVTTYPLYAPLVVDEPATAADLRRQPVLAEALARADALDLAVVAIGAWRSGESSVWEKVSPPSARRARTPARWRSSPASSSASTASRSARRSTGARSASRSISSGPRSRLSASRAASGGCRRCSPRPGAASSRGWCSTAPSPPPCSGRLPPGRRR